MAQYASDDGNGKAASSDVDQCLRYHCFLDETMLLLNWVQEQSQAYDRCQLTFKTEIVSIFEGPWRNWIPCFCTQQGTNELRSVR